ncbi:MAG: hypothetical protein ABR583_02660 [Gaiellaceae bacterium]
MKTLKYGLLAAMAALAVLTVAGGAGGRPAEPELGMAGKRSVTPDIAGFAKQHGPHSQSECIAPPPRPPGDPSGANVLLDCDGPTPNNEPDIEVHTNDERHMVASSNDYESCCDEFYTTTNNGSSWFTGDMSRKSPQVTGSDPVTSYDRKHDVWIHSSLNYSFQYSTGEACRGDLVVSRSYDGGFTWRPATVVDNGVGCDLSNAQRFNDKEWMETDNSPSSPFYGRTYITWTKFISRSGEYLSSPIYESHSDDGGIHWSTPKEISGSNAALCIDQTDGEAAGRCDENQFSVPTIGRDGIVYVAFQNSQNTTLWEGGEVYDDQYLLVKSTNGGGTWSVPSFVVGIEDGSRDYPLNVNGRQTLTGYQLRVNSAGNVVVDPRAGATSNDLYLVFSDNRNGLHDSDEPATNTDVFLMSSTSGGQSWSGPRQVDDLDEAKSDQWFPWVDVNPVNGTVGVLYHDRVAGDPVHYETTLTEFPSGGGPGVKTDVSTAPSDPVHSRYFRAGVAGCGNCATFHGDYIGLEYDRVGQAKMVWTDMRDLAADRPGLHLQFIYYARK